MASVLALLDATAFKKHAKHATPGAVLPIESYVTDERSFATALSHGGALYLTAPGEAPGQLWLVAVLEAPETSGIRLGDKRKPGWYAATNTTPVTDLSKLRGKLKIGKDLESALEEPRVLTPAQDRLLRELLDEVDAPVIAHAEPEVAPPKLDSNLPPLERAERYLAAGHPRPAIAALCAAWRTSRVPAFADLVDRATRLLPEYHRPLYERRLSWNDELETSRIWRAALAADAETAIPQLLLNLAVGGYDVIPKRVKELVKRPLDPRVSGRLVELLSYRPTWGERSWWPPVVEVLLKSRDARTFAALRELDSHGITMGAKTAKVYEMAQEPAPKLAAIDRPAVERIERELERLEEPVRTECALVDQIAAHPDDDGPYLVYADWLIERGRPLGEYISLACQQRQGVLSPAQARRLAILVEVPYLCGAFDDLSANRIRKRERGIDRELSVYWSTQPRSWALFAASPLVRALATVRMVGNVHGGRAEAIADFVRAAPALQRIADIGKPTGEQIAKLVDGFEVVEGDVIGTDDAGRAIKGADLVRTGTKTTRGGRSR